ncbi:CdaR family protein [Thermodesulfovibrionales bacterium]|nr:CdaR family protein [Thermodesulfovibrionales bacterium]MCL0042719.1 CdaR family protein [Thermodesulfovibrionales bacterium]MCL0061425.1 CdaR family protein [Thermodesulfovibrionales bacterium]MCL0067251.1 CdaR family protein [Thermodesulfovibrionales bacterium]MCL0072166.1 CdaR family protein [Thermodesulfovibrionales bacterium]
MKKKTSSNVALKIFSIVLAISLWLFVTYGGKSEMVIDAPIGFENIPDRLELLKQNIEEATLTIKGHERLLENLRPTDIRIAIDLTDAKKGEAIYYIDEGAVVAPRAIKILRIQPYYVKVILNEAVQIENSCQGISYR